MHRDTPQGLSDPPDLLWITERIGCSAVASLACPPTHTQHGLYSIKMALINSDCDAMRIHEHQMALITSECTPFRRDLAVDGRNQRV